MKMLIEEQKLEDLFLVSFAFSLAATGLGFRAADPCRGDLSRLGGYYPADRQRAGECRKSRHRG